MYKYVNFSVYLMDSKQKLPYSNIPQTSVGDVLTRLSSRSLKNKRQGMVLVQCQDSAALRS
jgi:hypothetical protein